jgi:hypothetical protein
MNRRDPVIPVPDWYTDHDTGSNSDQRSAYRMGRCPDKRKQ